jgi:hypothetical protein
LHTPTSCCRDIIVANVVGSCEGIVELVGKSLGCADEEVGSRDEVFGEGLETKVGTGVGFELSTGVGFRLGAEVLGPEEGSAKVGFELDT